MGYLSRFCRYFVDAFSWKKCQAVQKYYNSYTECHLFWTRLTRRGLSNAEFGSLLLRRMDEKQTKYYKKKKRDWRFIFMES